MPVAGLICVSGLVVPNVFNGSHLIICFCLQVHLSTQSSVDSTAVAIKHLSHGNEVVGAQDIVGRAGDTVGRCVSLCAAVIISVIDIAVPESVITRACVAIRLNCGRLQIPSQFIPRHDRTQDLFLEYTLDSDDQEHA